MKKSNKRPLSTTGETDHLVQTETVTIEPTSKKTRRQRDTSAAVSSNSAANGDENNLRGEAGVGEPLVAVRPRDRPTHCKRDRL